MTSLDRDDIVKTFENLSIKQGPVNNILKEISAREIGSKNNLQYKSDVTKIEMARVTRIPKHLVIEHNICVCLFIRSNTNKTITGVWQRNVPFRVNFRTFGSVCKLKFHYNKTCHNKLLLNLVPIVDRITTEGPYFDRVVVADCLDIDTMYNNYLLYVGNFMSNQNLVILYDLNAEKEHIWEVEEKIFCCARNSFKEYCAIGVEGGYCLLQNGAITPYTFMKGNIYALEYDRMGDILFVGGNQDGLAVIDARMNSVYNILYTHEDHFANEIKLLSDQVSLIVKNTNGEICKIDTRMWRTLYELEGQKDNIRKRPFNVCEDLDMICATGHDNISRIWSLSSGTLLNSFDSKLPFSTFGPAHCCFIVDRRRWFFTILQGNRMIPYSVPQTFL